MIHFGHGIATALYLAAALLGWAMRVPENRSRVAWLVAAGVLAHAAGLWGLHLEDPPIPLQSFPAALSMIGLLSVLGFLAAMGVTRIGGVTAWVGGFAGMATGLGAIGLVFTSPQPLVAPGEPAWSHAHVLLSTAGFALLALASLAGFAYLAKESDLKQKRRQRLLLPALESLDRFEHVTLSVGFALLTLGVATGFAWGAGLGVSPWRSHSVFLLAAWAVYILPVRQRVVGRQRGRKPARFVVIGFAVLAVSYIGVRLFWRLA